MTRCPSPCCKQGTVPGDARQDAMAVYVPIAGGELRPELLLMYPLVLVRWALAPFASEAWRREIGISCPFTDGHLQQAVLWLIACVLGTTAAVLVGVSATGAVWTYAPAGTLIAAGLPLAAALGGPVVWLAGQVLGAYRASEGRWSGPPLVGWMLPTRQGFARFQPPKASSSAPATAIDT